MLDENQYFLGGRHIRRDGFSGRTNVNMNSAKINPVIFAVFNKNLFGPINIHPEFTLFFTGGGVGMGPGINIGIYTQRGFHPFIVLSGQSDEVFQFRFGFNIEIPHTGIHGLDDLNICFAHPGINDFACIRTGLLCPEKLPAADNIKSTTRLG